MNLTTLVVKGSNNYNVNKYRKESLKWRYLIMTKFYEEVSKIGLSFDEVGKINETYLCSYVFV